MRSILHSVKEVFEMRKLIWAIAILYCIAPDLFPGPIDDALITLASMIYTAQSASRNRDPVFMRSVETDCCINGKDE